MRVIGWLFAAAYFIVVLWFALNNSTPVPVHLSRHMVWNEVPLVVVILACFFVGVVAGALALLPQMLRLQRRARTAGRQAKRVSTVDFNYRRTDRLADAARNAGAAGDLEAHTRTPSRKLNGF